mmetsp:Transcript_40504/g.90866  ORF Transcript_40504/g.90866 Transcript_40504/m.90866 type:complete len:1249 (+) Transcript_40504:122-3868(+)
MSGVLWLCSTPSLGKEVVDVPVPDSYPVAPILSSPDADPSLEDVEVADVGCLCASSPSKIHDTGAHQRRVQKLMDRVSREQPRELAHWLRAYAQELDGVRTVPYLPTTPASVGELEEESDMEDEGEIHRMLNWRFFLIQKEREIAEHSARIINERAVKWRLEGYVPPSGMGKRIASFVPEVIKDAIRAGSISLSDSETASSLLFMSGKTSVYNPLISTMVGAVVFADASGFTAMTEQLAKHVKGGEKIGACLNDFFGPLITIIHSYGGDILKFSGDAMTIVWPALTESANKDLFSASSSPSHFFSFRKTMGFISEGLSKNSKGVVVQAALSCCQEMQDAVESMAKNGRSSGSVPLSLHIGVGFGELSILQVGGLLDRWEYCACGEPLCEVAIGEELAKGGQVVVSPSIEAVLRESPSHGRGFKLEQAFSYEVADRAKYKLLLKDLSMFQQVTVRRMTKPARPGDLADVDSQLVERYIPRAMSTYVTSPEVLSGSQQITMDTEDELTAEMRRVTVIFLVLRGLKPGRENAHDCNRTHLLLRLFQRACYAMEGSINKFLVDDKGMLLLTVFGLPPLCHYIDDPTRAVLYAQRLCETARDEGVEGAAGVTTGQCWCGVIGNSVRREYSVLGDVVNLSARLMAKANTGEVLVDEETYSAAQEFLEFDSLGDVRVKGKEAPVEIFRFMGRLVPRPVREKKQLESPLLSWDAWPAKEIALKALKSQLNANGGGVVFVQGAPGAGKTQIVQHIKNFAEGSGYTVLHGQNLDPTSTFAVPMRCWQEVFQHLMRKACDDQRWQAPLSPQSKPLRKKGAGPAARLNFRSHMREGRDIYKLVTRMLVDGGASDDIVHWVPLLSLVVPGFTVGLRGVYALLERDERNTSGTPKLALLCQILLDVFNKHSSSSKGTVVLLHLRRGTSFYTQTHLHDAQIARCLGAACEERRKTCASGSKPMVFVVVSRQEVLPDQALLDQAKRLGGYVRVGNLSKTETEQYMRHVLLGDADNPGCVQECLVDHVQQTTGGNPFSIEMLSRDLENRDVLYKEPTSRESTVATAADANNASKNKSPGWDIKARPPWDHKIKLQELPYPEALRGIAVSVFERLSPADKVLLKSAAVCAKERVDGGDAVSVHTLAASMGVIDVAEIQAQCERLVEVEILREVLGIRRSSLPEVATFTRVATMSHDPTESGGLRKKWRRSMRKSASERLGVELRGVAAGHCYEFESQLLLDVALRLVLETQKERIMARRNSCGESL